MYHHHVKRYILIGLSLLWFLGIGSTYAQFALFNFDNINIHFSDAGGYQICLNSLEVFDPNATVTLTAPDSSTVIVPRVAENQYCDPYSPSTPQVGDHTVTVTDTAGLSQSIVIPVTIDDIPTSTPIVLQPSEGQIIDGSTVFVDWESFSPADRYRLEIFDFGEIFFRAFSIPVHQTEFVITDVPPGWYTIVLFAITDKQFTASVPGEPNLFIFDKVNSRLSVVGIQVVNIRAIFDELIGFYNEAVGDGSPSNPIFGIGPGASSINRVNTIRNMLIHAKELYEAGDNLGACQQLSDVINRADGQPNPPDFLDGDSDALGELIGLAQYTQTSLGCV